MGGDGYALALRAGAKSHRHGIRTVLSHRPSRSTPRSAWTRSCGTPSAISSAADCSTPKGEEFLGATASQKTARTCRPAIVATLAILKEVEAGRGSPHGGVYLSFAHCSEAALRAAFGPVIDRLAANHIDLSGGDRSGPDRALSHGRHCSGQAHVQTAVPGLFAAGEAVGGANGANRLSGNAVTEALVFGRRAGRSAAEHARLTALPAIGRGVTSAAIDLITADAPEIDHFNTAAAIEALQAAMAEDAGPLRDAPRLRRALATIADLTAALGERPCGKAAAFEMRRLEWLDLRNMLVVAQAVATAAVMRRESRGAHQREDFPEMLPDGCHRLCVWLEDGHIQVGLQ